MKNETKQHIVVLGAGMVGVACALKLLRSGHKVTLIDRQDPGDGASFGNAGVVGCSSIIAASTPGVHKKIFGMWRDPFGPLAIKLSYAIRRLPWFADYLKSSKLEKFTDIAKQLSELLKDAMDQHHTLVKGSAAERWLIDAPYTFAYKDQATFEGDSLVWDMRRRFGIDFQTRQGEALADRLPGVSDKFQFAASFDQRHGYISNPGKYVKALAEQFQSEGGELLKQEIKDIQSKDLDRVELLGDNFSLQADKLVVCTGIWSSKLLKRLHLKCPLESERGYHLMFEGHNVSLPGPVMSTSGRCVATVMEEGLRVAGLVEFSGIAGAHNQQFADTLIKHAKDLFPHLKYDKVTQWFGHRPSFPDALPMIGQLQQDSKIVLAFGHQHVGLMSGPKTAELVDDIINARTSDIDISPYRPERFS